MYSITFIFHHSTMTDPIPKRSSSNPKPSSSSKSVNQLSLLLGTPLRILLSDHRTLQGQLESIDSSSLLISSTLETRAPPTNATEDMYAENKDRYWPRSDSHAALEIRGLGIGREIGAVVVSLKDVLKVEVEEGCWRELERTANVI